MRRAVVMAVAALALLVSCRDRGEGRVRETVARSDREQLIADARALQRRFSQYDMIPEQEWPASFRAFAPKGVLVSPQGVHITTYEFFVATAGLFIRLDPAYEPPPHGDPGFTPIAPDLYWFYGGG